MNKRIDVLDGFRAIAILMVMLFHYFSRWTTPIHETNLYPYNQHFNYFSHGNLGVQFFFIISGFVIYFTLENTDKILVFWKKRIVRLLPSMLFASLITYLICLLLDSKGLFPQSHEIRNFLPSLTFISPDLLSKFGLHTAYISGSYWSLWPEIQFYLIVSLFYFFDKKRFLVNFIIFSIIIISFNHIMQNVLGTNKLGLELPNFLLNFYENWVINCFNLPFHLPYFFLGILFYHLFQLEKMNSKVNYRFWIIIILMILYILYCNHLSMLRFFILFFLIILFVISIYFPHKLKFLEMNFLSNTGKSSYFLYLIHENIGILFISLFCSSVFPLSLLFVVCLMFSLTIISIVFTKKIDFPLSYWLKNKIFK